MPRNFPALPGFYQALFLYIEPLLSVAPALVVFIPGPEWFYAQLIPGGTTPESLDERTTMAIWQLVNCYMFMALISSIVFRAIRDTLPNNPEAQERILGAIITVLASTDITHTILSWVALPKDLRYSFWSWNATTHGNITFIVILFCARMAWFTGIGRQRYYYGDVTPKNQKSA